MVSYSEVLAQLRDYYGSAADDKLTVLYKGGTLPNEEYESLLKSAGVSYTKYVNKSTGAVRYADYKIPISETFTKPIINGGVGEIANSNTALSTAESASTLDLPAKIVSTVDETTGETTIAVNTGKNAVATAANGSKVIGALGVANAVIVGASIGTTLGNHIAQELYEAYPDYWGGVNPSKINYKDYFGPVIGEFYNLYFGVKEDGNGQLYARENDFAAIALKLQELGFFETASVSTYTKQTSLNAAKMPLSIPYISIAPGETKQFYNKYYSKIELYNPTQYTFRITGMNAKYSHPTIFVVNEDPINGHSGYRSLRLTSVRSHDGYTYSQPVAWDSGFTYTINGVTITTGEHFYPDFSPSDLGIPETYIPKVYSDLGHEVFNDAVYALLYGSVSRQPLMNGVTYQPNAKVPNLGGISITAPDAVAQALAALKKQIPELWNNSVTLKVVQPDGTETDDTYIPIATPIVTPNNSEKPISGESTQTQPEVKTDDEPAQDTILHIIDPDPPAFDTGKGNTPPIIIPTSAANALWSIYNPTLAQVKQFGGWLWSDNFIDQLKKMFQEPAQAIIGLHKVYGTPKTGDESTIVVGYLDSGVPSKTVTKQYITVDCGAVSLPEFFGNVLDYTATEVSIFLPFVGVRQLSTADVMRSTISVKYHIDVLTGTGLAEISVRRDAAGGVLYQFSCDCAERFPISSGSYMGIVSGLVGVGAGIATAATGNLLAGGLMAANAIGNSHFDVNRTGNFSGNAGAMGGKVPYLIISRAQPAMANNFPAYVGKPANFTTTVGTCKGFIKCVVDHLENIPATADELTEIDTLLQQGILA